jgi:hypothetical protein
MSSNVPRAVLLAAVLGMAPGLGCSSTSEPSTGDLAKDLKHPDPRFRIEAAERVAVEDRMDLLPLLVRNLSDPDGAVRLFTAAALRNLTGLDFGYKPHGTDVERKAAVDRWNEWLESGAGPGVRAVPVPVPAPVPALPVPPVVGGS